MPDSSSRLLASCKAIFEFVWAWCGYYRIVLSLLSAAIIHTAHGPKQDSAEPAVPHEFRAAWVATVDNIDWPSSRTLDVEHQKAEMLKILDTAVAVKLNAIVFQVRPSCDALYDSKLEPWSEYLTGQQGKAPTPLWDPLAFTVEEAHRRGLEVHCWFNPYRAGHPAQKGPYSPDHIKNTHPDVVKSYGRYYWLDPGEPFVQKHSLQVIKDVVKRYDIDGVHIDDYFYPYPEKNQPFPDSKSYSRYVRHGGTLSLSDWRRQNVDEFVHGMYVGVKQIKPWVKVGISPFGIYRPGFPPSIKAGVDQYDELYADCRKWLAEGWCDYLSPQLYWPIAQKAQSFPVLLDWWISQNSKSRHIWPGLYTSRVYGDEGKTWALKEVLDQIEATRQREGSTGDVHFSMKAFLSDAQNINSVLASGLYAHRALVPASPWLEGGKIGEPSRSASRVDGKIVLHLKPGNRTPVRFYMVRVQTDRWLEPRITSESDITLSLDPSIKPAQIVVRAIDRVGIASDSVNVDLASL